MIKRVYKTFNPLFIEEGIIKVARIGPSSQLSILFSLSIGTH